MLIKHKAGRVREPEREFTADFADTADGEVNGKRRPRIILLRRLKEMSITDRHGSRDGEKTEGDFAARILNEGPDFPYPRHPRNPRFPKLITWRRMPGRKKSPGQANPHALTNRLTLSNSSLRSIIPVRLPGLYLYPYTASGECLGTNRNKTNIFPGSNWHKAEPLINANKR